MWRVTILPTQIPYVFVGLSPLIDEAECAELLSEDGDITSGPPCHKLQMHHLTAKNYLDKAFLISIMIIKKHMLVCIVLFYSSS